MKEYLGELSMNFRSRLSIIAFLMTGLFTVGVSHAAAEPAEGTVESASKPIVNAEKDVPAETDKKESPWLALPLVQVNPKLGTALGAMGAYLHYYDEKSRVSIFGAGGAYTSTDSAVAVVFAKTSFDEDRQRLVAILARGLIKNDYSDYLGTGVPVKTEDDMFALLFRYLYRVKDDWFVGFQGVQLDYALNGETLFDDEFLTGLGLTGFRSGAIGLSIYHDSRDNDNSPTRGWVLQLGNMAHRDWTGGDLEYDTYSLNFRGYLPHGEGNVLAARVFNQLTVDAPLSGSARIIQRGYKIGQYLGKNMSLIEVEERYKLGKSWTATLFYGIGCLYGDGESCTDEVNRYPGWGGGFQYILKPKEGIVANLEYAKGKWDNYGIYLKMGYGF
jgi:hypothetical protein